MPVKYLTIIQMVLESVADQISKPKYRIFVLGTISLADKKQKRKEMLDNANNSYLPIQK